MSEKDYPYFAIDSFCKYNESKGIDKVKGYVDVDKLNPK